MVDGEMVSAKYLGIVATVDVELVRVLYATRAIRPSTASVPEHIPLDPELAGSKTVGKEFNTSANVELSMVMTHRSL